MTLIFLCVGTKIQYKEGALNLYYSITFGCSRFSHLMENRDTNKDIVLGQQFYLLKWENENINGNTIDISYEIENQNTYHTSKTEIQNISNIFLSSKA